jgi:cohesin complex subunit SCC1
MKLKFDSSTILDRDSVSRAIKNAGDITIQRVPGVIRRVTDLADDDMPFGADEEKDENGKATLGYFRDAHGGCRPPDTPGEARSLLRGTSGHRDPLMGHRCSAEWLVMRAGCIRSLMERAGERRGGGFAAHRQKGRRQGGGSRAGSAAGSVRGEDDDVARAMEFDEDDGGDFGGGFGGEDDDDAGGYDDGNDDVPMTPTTTRRNDAAQNAADALNGSDQLPVPPTPAGVVSGHVDWSVATKRMLASLGPRLEEREVVDEKTGEIVVPVPVTVSEMCLARDANNSLKKVKKADAARTFYQVLVLKTHGFVELTQKGAYRDIEIVAGKKLVEQR